MGEIGESGLGQEPGADLGDDGDIPDDPLLGGEGGGEPGIDVGEGEDDEPWNG